MAKNIFIYAESDNGDKIYEEIKHILANVLDPTKFNIQRLTPDHENSVSWLSTCHALFIHNESEEKFDENMKRSLSKYFLDHRGKLLFLCNPDDGQKSVWFLKSIFEYVYDTPMQKEWPQKIGVTFEKFVHGQPIPINLQALTIDQGDRSADFSLGLVRGDHEIAFMYLVSEEGGSVAFVSRRPEKFDDHKNSPVWRDIMRVIRIIGIEPMPPHSPDTMEQCRMDAPCFGNPYVLVYAGPDDQADVFEKIAAVIRPLIGDKYKVAQLKHEDIINPISPSPWWANCVALFVQNDGGHEKFDEVTQKALAQYFVWSGKLILFCNPDDGHKAIWLLNSVPAIATSPTCDKSAEIGRCFEKLVKNEPIPSNLQCVQVQKSDKNADLFLGLVRASDGKTPYMYLRCDDGDTAVFVGAKVEDAIEREVPVWLDLLRLVGLANVE